MEILHVPVACALLWTLSVISPLDLRMDSPTRGTFCRRYWEEVTAIFAPCVTNGANYVTLIWEQWTLQSNTHMFFALTVFQHISAEELRKIYHSNVRIAGQFLMTLRHEKRPSNDVEVITNEPTDCCDWAMDTTLSTGIGNRHEERCICRSFCKKLRNCHHEGCNKKVHRCCQEDWLDHHCYTWTPEDSPFC